MGLNILHKGTEAERRWKIIDVSRAQDEQYLPQLFALLDGDETYDNKRHIIRALGKIDGDRAEEVLTGLLKSSKGLMLGDLCEALARLQVYEAFEMIEPLVEHQEEWVRQRASAALKKLSRP